MKNNEVVQLMHEKVQKQSKKTKNDVFVSVVEELVGEDAVNVAMALSKRKEATDEEISQETGIRLNDVRKILYKLHNFNLATYRRIRDDSTGWFTYFWQINKERVYDLIKSRKKLVLEKLKERLEYEKSKMFFYCPNDGDARLTFEEAMESSFKCPKCGNVLQHFDNSEIIKILEEKIRELEEEMDSTSK